jgi:hypothetical protein
VEQEAYDLLAGRITTRSWTWRLRLAAGEVDAQDPEAQLIDPVLYEVVIDLSAPRPRVAYMRDITWMRATALIAAAIAVETEQDLDADRAAEPADTEAAADDEMAAEGDLGGFDEPPGDIGEGDRGNEDLGGMPPFEQPAGPEPVSPDGADDSAAVGPPSQSAAPDRARIGRWTAG